MSPTHPEGTGPAPEHGRRDLDYRARFPNRLDSVRAIRCDVEAVARAECRMPERQFDDLRLAVSEAATNAIVHAHAASDAEVVVRVERSASELCVVIADQGVGMTPRTDSPGQGLGLSIISMLTTRFEVISQGGDGNTEVRMFFAMPQ